MKLAAYITATCSADEKALVDSVSTLETFWKRASDCLAAKSEVDARIAEITPAIEKVASEAGDYAKEVGNTARSLPSEAFGGDVGEVVSGALGTAGTDKPDYGLSAKSPLASGGQQRLRNNGAAVTFSSLLDDPYISQRPIPEIVKAFNSVMSTQPDADATLARRLVKDQLASGGDLDTDILLKMQKGHKGN
jgi:hypothetical protein